MRKLVLGLVFLILVFLGLALHDSSPPPLPYVIIHADDAGMCESVNRATIDAMESGAVSSASILVPCPGFEEFAAFARKKPEMDFGVHLALNSEWNVLRWGPVTPAHQVPSLVDADGFFWQTIADMVTHVRLNDAYVELKAQIDRAIDFGIPISHLDSHMYALLRRPDLLDLYVRLGIEYDLPVFLVRSPSQDFSSKFPKEVARAYQLALGKLRQHGLPIPDYVDEKNYYIEASKRRDYHLEYLRQLRQGVTVIPIHCAYADAQFLRTANDAMRRDADRRVFSSLEIAHELEIRRIKVITWKEFREMEQCRVPLHTSR